MQLRFIIVFALVVAFVFLCIGSMTKSAIAEKENFNRRVAFVRDSLAHDPRCVYSVDPGGELEIYVCDDRTYSFRVPR